MNNAYIFTPEVYRAGGARTSNTDMTLDTSASFTSVGSFKISAENVGYGR